MTGTGTFADPIVAMSADPVQIAHDIRASLAAYGRTDDPYWNEKESTPAQFSNGLWFLGHNAYWEARMNPTNPGSADPNLGRLPAHYSAESLPTAPAPAPLTPRPPLTPAPPSAVQQQLEHLELLLKDSLDQAAMRERKLQARLDEVSTKFNELVAVVSDYVAASYTGTVEIKYLGKGKITLEPIPRA